ncbi:ChbG/HpnK family deacetylase [bacterium]|nr:ChbG/HpnK family deacetylase [bacterium]RQV93787.1 MAG: ChbG/HpnK family deacetylase [bacterium]
MGKLIIHADDFGLTKQVNEGIIQAHTKGIVTSASIMANGSSFEHAVELYRLSPTLDIGIHLNLIEELPILEKDRIKSLVDEDGKLHRDQRIFVKKYLRRKICLKEVEDELEMQIQKVMDSGIKPSHIDSHQHLHMLPGILSVTLKLMKRYDILAVRLPCETIRFKTIMSSVSISRVIQLMILNFLSLKVKRLSLLGADHFSGFLYSGKINHRNLEALLDNLPQDGVCELMCHPGLENEQSDYHHWGYRWSDELNALTDPSLAYLIWQKGFELVSYQDLLDHKSDLTQISSIT